MAVKLNDDTSILDSNCVQVDISALPQSITGLNLLLRCLRVMFHRVDV